MVPLEKWYFPLEEIEERWKLKRRDLAYMAEMDELRLSVRVDGVLVERGILEAEDGVTARIRYERSVYSGLQELTARDASRVFRKGRPRSVTSTPRRPASTSASCRRAPRSG